MKAVVFFCTMLAGIGSVSAQVGAPPKDQAPPDPARQSARPAGPAPAEPPPAPPLQPPAIPAAAGPAVANLATSAEDGAELERVYTLGDVSVSLSALSPTPMGVGRWIYTEQYGWLYLPYGDQYVVQAGGAEASAYVYAYYPEQGWTWLPAPWVAGVGPYPYGAVLGLYDPWLFGSHGSVNVGSNSWLGDGSSDGFAGGRPDGTGPGVPTGRHTDQHRVVLDRSPHAGPAFPRSDGPVSASHGYQGGGGTASGSSAGDGQSSHGASRSSMASSPSSSSGHGSETSGHAGGFTSAGGHAGADRGHGSSAGSALRR